MTDLAALIDQLRSNRLAAYRVARGDVREHAGIEETVLAGGYGYRQVLELVQNGADAILEANEQPEGIQQPARIEVVLRERHLYVANTGAPLSEEGVTTLLQSHDSRKRGNQIGRFGLGFKSLLRLGGALDIFSTSGSLRFDPERCRVEIRREFELTDDAPVPALRLAWALNRTEEEADDSMLASFSWATTIVRAEIRNRDVFPHLQDEIGNFPSPFLLFLPVAVALDLDDGKEAKRQLRRKPDGLDMLLLDDEKPSRWRVTELSEVRITDALAKSDATHLHARESVPIAWATPLDAKREESGRFWAFFPTDTPTRLPGILNAPWKLNSDRKALIPGDWNNALMREAAKLIAATLPSLATDSDPGRPLDAFPRRLERQDEPAAQLVNGLWEQIESAKIIANASGELCPGRQLKRPPLDAQELHEQWRKLASEKTQASWVHSTCLAGERAARLKELSERLRRNIGRNPSPDPTLTQTNAAAWLGTIASAETGIAKDVIKLAESYQQKQEAWLWEQDRTTLAIIPTTGGKLCTPDQLVIAPADISISNRETVPQALVDDAEVCRILTDVLKVKRLDDKGWHGLLREEFTQATKGRPRENDNAWRQLWNLLRLAPQDISENFLGKHREELRVRRRDGAWVLYDEVLLPGSIVSTEDSNKTNRGILVDEATHGADHDRLKMIEIRECPAGAREPGKYESVLGERRNLNLMQSWLQDVESSYRAKLDTSSNPQSGYLRPLTLAVPRGWMLLAQVKELANARLTNRLLDAATRLNELVEFGHTTRRDAYPVTQISHPMHWFIRRHGSFAVGQVACPLELGIARRDLRAISELEAWKTLAPHIDRLINLVGVSAMPAQTTDKVRSLWQALFKHLATPAAIVGDGLQYLWSEAARDGCVPDTLPTGSGDIPLADVFVTSSPNLARLARAQGRMVVALDEEALKCWLDKGARNLDVLFRPKWDLFLSPPAPLETAVPELAEVLRDEVRNVAMCQSVSALRLVIEEQPQPMPCIQWQGILYLDPDQLGCLSRTQRLETIVHEVAAAGWLRTSADNALRGIGSAQVETNRARVKAGKTLAERLLIAVGGRREPLVKAIGESAGKAASDCNDDVQVADLALAMLGPTVLQELTDTLKEEGLQPPARWGGDDARTFAAALGFPEDFASSTESKREAEESISGPIHLPELHDYQDKVVAGLRNLISIGTGRRRAVVSLPTGGGKTRVMVQAAVDLVLKPESGKRVVLWVAQTDELCEQAVQAFRQVWLNRGEERTDLRIVRFWGGHRNPNPSTDGQPTAVIASIQTLNNRIEKEGLDWLSNPGLVVVDECHHAITKSYSSVLRWLDAEAPRPGSKPKDEPPIIGLSATPFRGSGNDEENLRLAKRFDQRWLPADQKGLHEALTERGILSRADHEPLESPTVLSSELIERLGRDGPIDSIQLENLLEELNRVLADDEDRNRILIDTIVKSQQRSILFFTNSVNHAKEMAARLTMHGITAAAISGDMASSARRYFLNRFQRGDVRVLCNHSVLTTGFDAPKTDMVLIARQVLSPVRYMQMVGRGLRGVENGGTERCRIVTVLDNLGRFSEVHPYHFCSRYFSNV
ncbi:MAG: DEAD/DEAH box helicase [Sulfuritalea sp.]|nr:DEAD/DEAH box helicase [Sulfuritalea sp.]